MNPVHSILVVGILVGVGMFAVTQASSDQKSDPTSAAAWSAGNASGAGNFMSYCMSCHGPEGKGDGILADSLDVKPRNLSDAAFMSSKPNDHLFKVIKEGGAAVGLTENMTPFMGQLSDKEINNVISYIRKDLCQCEFEQN